MMYIHEDICMGVYIMGYMYGCCEEHYAAQCKEMPDTVSPSCYAAKCGGCHKLTQYPSHLPFSLLC